MSFTLVPETFTHCPRCGSSSVSRSELKRLDCSDCGFQLYFNPTSSAAALVFDKRGRLLVITRARNPAKGKYGVPGGFTDIGERLEEVALREAKEETNLDLHSLRFFASFPNTYPYKEVAYPVIDVYFLAEVDNFEGIAAEESEVAGIHFVDPKVVPEEQWAFDSLRKVIRKLIDEGLA